MTPNRFERKWHRVVCCVTVLSWFLGLTLAAQSNAPTEYEVKAAYLYNFAKFVDWPADNPGAHSKTLTIGVLGKDPFGAVLDETVAGKTIRGRNVVIRRANDIADLADCQVVFVSADEARKLGGVPDFVVARNILTVGETHDFVVNGGIVSFRKDNHRIGFDINVQAAARARLVLGSQLLKLAHIVE